MQVADFLSALRSSPNPNILLADDPPQIRDRSLQEEHLVFVGCEPHPILVGINPATSPLLLTNKGSRQRFELAEDYTSVTAMVATEGARLLKDWSFGPGALATGERTISPQELLPRLTLVVEDAGPDSVFGVALLLACCAGIQAQSFFPAWQRVVDDWERRGNTLQPMGSWCALESALAHRHFPQHTQLISEVMSAAWRDCLRFLAAALALDHHPDYLPDDPICDEHAIAKAALQQEQQAYEQWLQRAQVVQLALPLAATRERVLLVDALFVDEEQITGATRVFYRNDTVNAPLKSGFGFAVHYRPYSADANADITITVDPRRGVTLKPLHDALEKAEDGAWEDRKQVRSTFPPRVLEGVLNTYEQPWYMDREHTLIAAPKRLLSGGYGSLLDRNQVMACIWETFHPLKGIRVVPFPNVQTRVNLLDLAPLVLKDTPASKRLFAAVWPRVDRAHFPLSLPNAPTISRMFAAITFEHLPGALPALNSLPSPESYERVSLEGGWAVVTDAGAFVLDDWTPATMDLKNICDAFSEAAQLDACVELFQSEVKKLTGDLKNHLNGQSEKKSVESLLRATADLSTQISQSQGEFAMPPSSASARIFRDALSRRWSLDARLNALSAEVLSLQTALRTSLEIRTASTTRFIATFGFAAAIAATLAAPLAKWIAPHLNGQPITLDAPGKYVLGVFLTLAAIVYLALYLRFRSLDLQQSGKKSRGAKV